MKLQIAPAQASTLRGWVWVATFFVGVVLLYLGKDVTPLLLLAGGVAGGLGVGVKDELKDILTPESKAALADEIQEKIEDGDDETTFL